jgi:putative transposase
MGQMNLIDKNYKTKPGRKFLLRAHVIFVVKYRKKLLTGSFDQRLKAYIMSLVTTKFDILLLETDVDHIHILIDYDPTVSVSSIVRRLKQISTNWIWQHVDLKKHFWKENTFWSDGYFVASTGEASTETIRKYIENQG